MASKTRDKLIEAARQLFIRKGVEKTTISDIANASDKGRRTIYTYFKDKKEIYNAVIERESDKMVSEIKVASEKADTATDKLRNFINVRVSQSKSSTSSYTTIKSLIGMDFGRTERARRVAAEKEQAILNSILNHGIATGEFDPQKVDLLRKCLYQTIKAIDLMLANEDDYVPPPDFTQSLAEFVLQGLAVHPRVSVNSPIL